MNSKSTNKNTSNDQSVQDLVAQIDNLTSEAKKVNQGIIDDNKETDAWMTDLKGRVDENIDALKGIYADLDSATKEAESKLDDIASREAADLANDEDLGE